MKVALACDHRGFEAKKRLLPVLKKNGHELKDFGCDSPTSCDYPDFAIPAAQSVARNENDIGILLDGSGIGMSVAANKVKGVRAALVHDEFTARGPLIRVCEISRRSSAAAHPLWSAG